MRHIHKCNHCSWLRDSVQTDEEGEDNNREYLQIDLRRNQQAAARQFWTSSINMSSDPTAQHTHADIPRGAADLNREDDLVRFYSCFLLLLQCRVDLCTHE